MPLNSRLVVIKLNICKIECPENFLVKLSSSYWSEYKTLPNSWHIFRLRVWLRFKHTANWQSIFQCAESIGTSQIRWIKSVWYKTSSFAYTVHLAGLKPHVVKLDVYKL